MTTTLPLSSIALSLIGVGFFMPSVRRELVEYYTGICDTLSS